MVGWALLLIASAGGPVLTHDNTPSFVVRTASEPKLHLDGSRFSLPVVDYQAPDGTWKHGNGIIIGREVSRNTTVGIGFFRSKPKNDEAGSAPMARKTKKVSVGVSWRF